MILIKHFVFTRNSLYVIAFCLEDIYEASGGVNHLLEYDDYFYIQNGTFLFAMDFGLQT